MEKPEERRGVVFCSGTDVPDAGADCLDAAEVGVSAGWVDAVMGGVSGVTTAGCWETGEVGVTAAGGWLTGCCETGSVFVAGAVRRSDCGATGAAPDISPAVRCGGGAVGVTTEVGCGLGVGAGGVTTGAAGAVCAGVTGV